MNKRPMCVFALCFVFVVSLLAILDYDNIINLPLIFKESAVNYIEDESGVELVGVVYKYEEKNGNLLIYLRDVKLKNKSKIYNVSKVIVYNSLENQIKVRRDNDLKNESYISNPEKKNQININSTSDEEKDIGEWSDEYKTNRVAIGNQIKVSGSINKFKKATNYGQFDSEKYYKSLGIETSIYARTVEIIDLKQNRYVELLYNVRARLAKNLDRVMDEETSGIVKAMLLGDKSDLTEDVKELYQKAGASHLIEISGIHLSIIGISVYKLLRKGGLKYLYAGIMGIIFVISYGCMTGFAISTKRAVIMCVLMIIAGILGRTYDMLTALSVSIVIMVIDNPYCVFNMGFLLSYGAVLSIGVVYPILHEYFEKYEKNIQKDKEGVEEESSKILEYAINVKKVFLKGLLAGISINLVTFPIILNSFYEFPIYSIFLNVIIIPMVGVVLYSGVASMLTTFLWIELGKMCIGIGALVLDTYEILFKIVNKLPCATIIIGKPSGWQLVIYYGGLISLLLCIKYEEEIIQLISRYIRCECLENSDVKSRLKEVSIKDIEVISNNYEEYQNLLEQKYRLEACDSKRLKKKIICMGCVVIFLLTIICCRFESGLNITMLDVGQGECIVIRTPDKSTIMIDSGSTDEKQIGKYKVLPFLKAKGYKRLDYFILTHPDEDHISGLKEIIETDYKIQYLVMPQISIEDEKYMELINLAQRDGIKILYLKKGEKLKEQKLELLCLHPYDDYSPSSRNDYSTVISLTYEDFSMLFTGDIESKGENELVDIFKNNPNVSYDVLKVSHHGSKNSTSMEFLERVNPKLAIISCGEDNSYGHPHKELLERLEKEKVNYKITKDDGAISLNISNKGKAIMSLNTFGK